MWWHSISIHCIGIRIAVISACYGMPSSIGRRFLGDRREAGMIELGFLGSGDRSLCAIDRPWEFRSGLLRLNGEQRLPGMAEMLGREAIEWLRPLRCEQMYLTAEEGVEGQPERREVMLAPEARNAGLHEIGPVGLHIGCNPRLRGGGVGPC